MEKLNRKQEKFKLTLDALERSIKLLFRQDIVDEEIREGLVASTIKHFEMCYEASWKFLQRYLEYKYDTKIDSPKKVFRECFTLGAINNTTTQELLNMTEARNGTVHDYNEESAQEICKRISDYFMTLKKLEILMLED